MIDFVIYIFATIGAFHVICDVVDLVWPAHKRVR